MDLGGPQLLSDILSPEELEQTPEVVQGKLKTYLDGFFDEYCKEKAAANRLGDYEQKTEELQAQIQDYEVKLQNYNQNVDELRIQLDTISSERAQLLASTSSYQKELESIRQEKNAIIDERDSLLKVIERQTTELERQQQEIKSYQQQLKATINAKCEAIARLDEIEGKESALDFKERRMEQERSMMQNQIQTLSEDLNRNILELQKIRRDNTMQSMHLETKLSEKTEELKIVQSQCVQYKETIDRLTQNVQDLSTKIHNQNDEANKMMDYYKKELEAKSKLAELYKSNYEDTDVERSELGAAIGDLKRMLAEASDQYGELETKLKATILKFEQEIEEKNKIIDSQKAEILHANDLLKEVQNDTMETAISKIAPSAAVASRLIRADMSLTELYSLYVKTSESLEVQKRENSRLSLQLKTILHELGENAPLIKKQELQYEKLIETNNILAHQRDELISKKTDMEELLENAHSKISHLDRENKKLKHSQTDLSRQVCYLLKEIEQLRLGFSTDNKPSHIGNFSTTSEVISKKLVTFSNVPELQENNQKLLLLVRDLSNKLEDAENLKNEINESSYKEKLESYSKKLQTMQDTLNQQNNTVSTLVSKCERYKKMYFDVQKKYNRQNSENDLSDLDDSESNDGKNDAKQPSANASSMSRSSIVSGDKERRIQDLERQLDEVKDQYKTIKEQYEYYIQEKKNNEKIMNEQFDSMRTEVRELTSTNCKLMSTVEYTSEQIKLQQKNIATYKQQISVLEERNKNYENTIVKHEQSLLYLKDEVMNAQKGHSAAEAEANHLRHENRLLKDTAGRLQSEKEGYHRERQNQNLLLNNLELIKANLERSEIEGRARLEQRLDETVRELSAQRRRFQEEEDRFRELTADLKRQAETAKERMEEEKASAKKLSEDLTAIRKELSGKTAQIDELSKKLQESLTPTKNDNPIMLANKKARALEVKLDEAGIEITSLTSELAKAREHADQYYKISQSAEKEIKSLHEVYTNFVAKAEAEIKTLKQSDLNLKSRIEELEAEVQLSTVTETSQTNQTDQLKKSQNELKDALQKLSDCNRLLRSLRSECSTLTENLNAVETKYANEMVLHSADIQEMSKLKSEVTKFQDEINKLTNERDSAKSAYIEIKNSNTERLNLLTAEKEELEKRVVDLNSLNSTLHDQIEALTAKLSVLSRQSSSINLSTTEHESIMETSTSEANISQSESDDKNNQQLLQIIKFLRKEKDLSVAKLDILKAENARLISEHTILQKKLDELNGFLNQERTKTETVTVTALKHEEILRKIETLNALTDSNRILREERDALSTRVRELNDRIGKVEDELFPLQKQNRECIAKIEEITMENNSIRNEAIKWRQRANVLVEKSNKNPEEFKRLQNERENLAKMLTHEKEVIKQANEELATVKAEKAKLENELNNIQKVLLTANDEKKKLADDFNALKLTSTRMTQEVMELKNKLLQKEDTLQKLSEDLEAKDAQLQDSKNKEIQIRKIAKRYKDSYLELSNKTAASASVENNAGTSQDTMELGANNTADGASAAAVPSTNSELEQLRDSVESLNNVIKTMQDENEKIRKDYDELKASAEIDDRTKTLLREAKSRIVSLTESKHAVTQELATTKTRLQTFIQSAEDHDAAINGIKSQYEETFTRMEKELIDHNNQSKETIARLTRENEALLIRVTQLSRQLGLQQSSKPSTSSGTISDKSCMSESSPRTANVKPMSGSATVQQSATVTPWRGSETPLASIRPISVQNSRTAAILPTSQQNSGSSSATTSTSSSSTTPSSAGCSNTALVPPQQQVHTTGTNSVESMSSSPTSSHTDYMPSTSSASVAVAAIPPMATAAESSQEAESLQQQQTNESQLMVSGGQQAVALVSPRVEGSTQNAQIPILLQQETSNQQPSTSGSSSSSCHVAVSSHSRHTPSSSNVTTTQAGSSGGHKRPREIEGDSSTSADENGGTEKTKHPKRTRTQMQSGEAAVLVGVSESGVDVEYQVPTSSQRDQEDDIVVVDSEEDDGVVDEGNAEADDGPADGDGDNERYEDIYEQDHDMDENDCPDIDESNIQADAGNNEVDVDECIDVNVHCTSEDNQVDVAPDDSGASTSQAAAATFVKNEQQENNQQSQTISSGSCEPTENVSQAGPSTWKPSTSSFSRQQRATLMMLQQGINDDMEVANNDLSVSHHSDSFNDDITSPQDSKFDYTESAVNSEGVEAKAAEDVTDKCDDEGKDAMPINNDDEDLDEEGMVKNIKKLENAEEGTDGEELPEEASVLADENLETESHNSNGATQSEIQDFQQDHVQGTGDENEGVDGVSSEGEKQAVEDDMEEEGREAEASTSPSINTRSKTTRGSSVSRRPPRGFQRGGRPTPIVWQGHSRHLSPNQRNQDQPGSPSRGYPNQRAQRARRLRRPAAGNYGNMRYN